MPSIEGNIQTVLKVEAEAVSIPGANLALLIGGGQRAKRRRRITQLAAGLASAAVTVAVAGVVISASGGVGGESAPAANPTGSGVSTGQPASDPLGGLEIGGRPDPAYVTQGQLHVGEGDRDVRRNELFEIVSVGQVSMAYASPQRILLLQGTTSRTLDSSAQSEPVISSDGSLAAWVSIRSGRTVLVLWDLAAMEEVAQQEFIVSVECCDSPGVQPLGIDQQGRVYLTADSLSVIWDPDEASLKEITGLEGHQGLSAVIPAGPVFVDRTETSGPATSTYGLVDEHGRFEPVGRVPTRSGAWSPSGDIVAYTTSSTRAVTKPIADEAVPLDTPSSMRIGEMMWESSRAVLVVVLDQQGHATWLRCDVGTGGCVIAADLGDDTRYSTDWQVARN